jgi:hypothetical protein
VGGNFAEDEQVAEALAAHLAQDGKVEVRRVDVAELEPARQRGEISSATVVLLAELRLREGMEMSWDTAPVQSCGYYGCSTQYQSLWSNAPAVSGELVLTVYEGPTARVLQRERLQRAFVGDDTEFARATVVAMLTEAALEAVDIRDETVRVELYRTKQPEEAKRALAELERGHWKEGRALLEQAKDKLGGLSTKEQAQVWFNLGIARRFAPGPQGLDEAAYHAAFRALQWAARLDPKPAHHVALERLEHAYQDSIDLAEQRKARKENFEAVQAAGSPPTQGGETAPGPENDTPPAPDASGPVEAAPGEPSALPAAPSAAPAAPSATPAAPLAPSPGAVAPNPRRAE